MAAVENGIRLSDFKAQGAVCDGLTACLNEDRLPHACLITGPAGVGKRTLAGLVAAHLLCSEKADKRPCGVCASCRQIRSGNHPDLVTVRPGRRVDPGDTGTAKSITVGDIRALNQIAGTESYEGRGRVVIIESAEKMGPQGANALLKTLEDPPSRVTFILTTESPSALLPTIRSRCALFVLRPWPDEYVLKILEGVCPDRSRARHAVSAAGGSIGRAVSLATDEAYWARRTEIVNDFFACSPGDVMNVSLKYKNARADSDEILDTVEDVLRSLILVRSGTMPVKNLEDLPTEWRTAAEKSAPGDLVGLIDAVHAARRMRENQVTWQAVLERLLFRMMEESRKWQG